ncbi:DNA repair protein RecN [Corynebacterium sp. NML140438]|uniref:DNA repair protein RecN n=1 Tax=Corynebacterium sp. NML140438 TaxID=1906334 RepID=UPI0008FB4005|nr:DNA repair protein RecN [Corynebacterium sp. NML140438]OIR42289.1 DNA repair protein RecN [Corynebacterium sp. NML140438]
MLSEIAINNLGVIPHASAELSEGLTVLTGETGAGKTMVVTGLRLLTGGRADASRVRTGATEAVVEGAFAVDGIHADSREALEKIAENAGAVLDENGEYVVVRSVKATGRSKAHFGGRAVPAATLSDVASHLLTIHGQNDQLRLMSPEQQLHALDRFDPGAAKVLGVYREAWKRWRAAKKDLEERTKRRRELAMEQDRLLFAVNEIDEVAPEPGEDVELVGSIQRLQDVDGLRSAVQEAMVAIDGAEAVGEYDDAPSASDLVGQASSALSAATDPQLQELGHRLEEAASVLSDVSSELGTYLFSLDADPHALESMLQRQQSLKVLTRKYASDIDGVLRWRDEAQQRLASIDTSDEALAELQQEVDEAAVEMRQLGAQLTSIRRDAAERFSAAVTKELHGLAMPKAVLSVNIEEAEYSRDGADTVEIRLSPNAAAEPKPLATSASGGELSRVMLAIEVILAGSTHGATLVFDEVDAGVGGQAAVEIGRRLARLAVNNQVIVVTHLPQVAAYADRHLHVAKDVSDEAVTSGVLELDEAARVEELARMMAGMANSETGKAHAAELLEQAQRETKEFRL